MGAGSVLVLPPDTCPTSLKQLVAQTTATRPKCCAGRLADLPARSTCWTPMPSRERAEWVIGLIESMSFSACADATCLPD